MQPSADGKYAMIMFENEWYKKHRDEFKDCLRCDNCGGLTLVTTKEYVEHAFRKHFWFCGECGAAIDPWGLKERLTAPSGGRKRGLKARGASVSVAGSGFTVKRA